MARRTTIIYELSNRYSSNPWWYVDPTIVDASFITTFTSRFFTQITVCSIQLSFLASWGTRVILK